VVEGGEDPLANTKSAKKRVRQNSRRRLRNARVRTRARSGVRSARQAIEGGQAGSPSAVQAAIQELDRAASRGVIHPNNAARRKSRLQRQLRKSTSGGK